MSAKSVVGRTHTFALPLIFRFGMQYRSRVSTELAKYTGEEERAIRLAMDSAQLPECPRCHVRMTHREIGGGSFGLGYHRTREWLLCPSCKRSVLFDRKRGTRL